MIALDPVPDTRSPAGVMRLCQSSGAVIDGVLQVGRLSGIFLSSQRIRHYVVQSFFCRIVESPIYNGICCAHNAFIVTAYRIVRRRHKMDIMDDVENGQERFFSTDSLSGSVICHNGR